MRLLVTGATGFLGRHVVDAIRRRDAVVRVLVRPATKPPEAWLQDRGIEIFRGDLRCSDTLGDIMSTVDGVVHLAATVEGDDDARWIGTAVATERLLAAMVSGGVHRLVLAGSFSVYDWRRIGRRLHEQTPLEEPPDLYERDGYAVAKRWQERLVRRWAASGRRLTVLRPGFIWDLDHPPYAGLGQRVGPLFLAISPWARPPLTRVDVCAEVFARAATEPAWAGRTVNVVDTDRPTTWDVLGMIRRHTDEQFWRVPVPYVAAKSVTALAQLASRILFGREGRLPSILTPRKFEARFRPIACDESALRQLLAEGRP